MNAFDELLSLYERWRVLTGWEAKAIRDGDWDQMTACQQQKTLLQSKIVEVSDRLALEHRADRNRKMAERAQLQTLLEKLVTQESENQENLARRRAVLEAEKVQLDRAIQNLGDVSRAYRAPREPNWQSYS